MQQTNLLPHPHFGAVRRPHPEPEPTTTPHSPAQVWQEIGEYDIRWIFVIQNAKVARNTKIM